MHFAVTWFAHVNFLCTMNVEGKSQAEPHRFKTWLATNHPSIFRWFSVIGIIIAILSVCAALADRIPVLQVGVQS